MPYDKVRPVYCIKYCVSYLHIIIFGGAYIHINILVVLMYI